MTVTSVDVNREVLDQIKAITKMTTDKEVINTALERMLAHSRQDEFLERMKTHVFAPEDINPPKIEYPI